MRATRRYSYEIKALQPFREVISRRHLSSHRGQSAGNRIVIHGNLYFQFGDLRVPTPTGNIIVEVESAGGITNLAKYWYCFENQFIDGRVDLVHLFLQSAPGDYGSHLAVWDLLAREMLRRYSIRFSACRFTYRTERLRRDMRPAVEYFQRLLDQASTLVTRDPAR